MSASSLGRLLLLSAIWGASFLFMRITVPVLGPSLLIFVRVGLAALFLLVVAQRLGERLDLRQHGRHYLMLGFFNSALPFFLFAYGAQTAPASLLSILNATAPIWATAMTAIWTRKAPGVRSLVGMALGVLGVGLLAGVESLSLPQGGHLAVLAGLLAAASYGVATTYTKTAASVPPFANAHGSMWGATLFMAPAALIDAHPVGAVTPLVVMSVLALGVLCSGVAYLLYFRLIAELGAAPALTVTFLIPVFGILWGVLFLGEHVGWHTAAGSLLVLTGTALVTGFSPSRLFSRQAGHAA